MAERDSPTHTELYGLNKLELYSQVAPYCDAAFNYTIKKFPGENHTKTTHPYDGLPKTVDSYTIPPGCVIAEVAVYGDQILLFQTAQVVEEVRSQLSQLVFIEVAHSQLSQLVEDGSITLELPPMILSNSESVR